MSKADIRPIACFPASRAGWDNALIGALLWDLDVRLDMMQCSQYGISDGLSTDVA